MYFRENGEIVEGHVDNGVPDRVSDRVNTSELSRLSGKSSFDWRLLLIIVPVAIIVIYFIWKMINKNKKPKYVFY